VMRDEHEHEHEHEHDRNIFTLDRTIDVIAPLSSTKALNSVVHILSTMSFRPHVRLRPSGIASSSKNSTTSAATPPKKLNAGVRR